MFKPSKWLLYTVFYPAFTLKNSPAQSKTRNPFQRRRDSDIYLRAKQRETNAYLGGWRKISHAAASKLASPPNSPVCRSEEEMQRPWTFPGYQPASQSDPKTKGQTGQKAKEPGIVLYWNPTSPPGALFRTLPFLMLPQASHISHATRRHACHGFARLAGFSWMACSLVF